MCCRQGSWAAHRAGSRRKDTTALQLGGMQLLTLQGHNRAAVGRALAGTGQLLCAACKHTLSYLGPAATTGAYRNG